MKQVNPPNQIQKKALRIQKAFFKTLQSEINFLLGPPPASILKYEKENNKDFLLRPGQSPHFITKSTLLKTIQEGDVTFIGDYHTFDQAQRTALRIIREVIEPASHWVIGLELIPSHQQKQLDEFQAGRLSLLEFHEVIQYSQEWGFPWKHYEPIFQWAKENQIRLIALNQPKLFSPLSPQSSDLKDRDRWAAGIITDLFRLENKLKVLVLYGELHVGTAHLPKQLQIISEQFLEKRLKSVTIHQNHDQLYWKMAHTDLHQKPSIIELKKNVFCVFSSTPWAKLQSLMSWAEGGTPPHLSLAHSPHHDSLSFDEEFHSEGDDLHLFAQFVKSLTDFFEVSTPSLESVSIHRADQTQFLTSVQKKFSFHREEIKIIRSLVRNHQKVYIPQIGVAYLGTGSINSMIELAAIHILRENHRSAHFFKKNDNDFFRLILESTFGFLGSLILNPNRKCDLPIDHVRRLEDVQSGEKIYFPDEPQARSLTLQFLPDIFHEKQIQTFSILPIKDKLHHNPTPLYLSTRYMGQILAKKLHIAILEDHIHISRLKPLFLAPPRTPEEDPYRTRFSELMSEIQHIPLELSKNESL